MKKLGKRLSKLSVKLSLPRRPSLQSLLLMLALLLVTTNLIVPAQSSHAQTDHPLAALANEESMPHAALQAAWQDYQSLSQELAYVLIQGETKDATTIDDILNNFEPDAELERLDVADNEHRLIYHYVSENDQDPTSPDKARLLLHFMDDNLLMLSLFNGVHLASPEFFTSSQTTTEIYNYGASVDELASNQPQVTALADMVFQDEPISIFVSFSGETVENAMTDFFVIVGDEVVDVYQTPIAAGADGFENHVIDAFLTYFNSKTQIKNVN